MRVFTNNNLSVLSLTCLSRYFLSGSGYICKRYTHYYFFWSIRRYLIFWQLHSLTYASVRGRPAPAPARHAWHHHVCFKLKDRKCQRRTDENVFKISVTVAIRSFHTRCVRGMCQTAVDPVMGPVREGRVARLLQGLKECRSVCL